jgi:hypothetical protein
LRGEVEAAEQHVKILREQIAAFAPAHETNGKRPCECKGVCAMDALVPFYCTGAVKTNGDVP